MNVEAVLKKAIEQLEQADVGTARLDCLVLMEDVIGTDRAQLLAHPERELTQEQVDTLQKLIGLRAQHIPLAYVRGKTEFYGREFMITPVVLEPRPESETMIDLLKTIKGRHHHIVDVGTGSGALGITAALELPGNDVTLSDIDEAAIQVAEQNCARFEVDLSCIVDDMLSHAIKRGVKPDIILANLPYVPNSYQINTSALHEPKLAIFGGPDGLDLYRRLFTQCHELQPAHILTESLPFQHHDLAHLAGLHGYKQARSEDFIQLFTREDLAAV